MQDQVLILHNCYQRLEPSYLKNFSQIELDLGCGKGLFTMELARKNPDCLFIAVDIKLNRLKKLLNKIKHANINNILVIKAYANPFLAFQLPDNILDKIHIICPDPWPKKRHRKHRMFNSEFISLIKKSLKNKGAIHFASDDMAYCNWAYNILDLETSFSYNDRLTNELKSFNSEFKIIFQKINKDIFHRVYLVNK